MSARGVKEVVGVIALPCNGIRDRSGAKPEQGCYRMVAVC
jgi:hypothetical protein